MQTKRKQTALAVLTGLTLCFIWGNSLMPGEVSSALSDWAGAVLSRLFGTVLETESGHGVLRKVAHGTEYLLLGLELSVLLRRWMGKPWSLVLLCGMSAALADETIQLFVDGRAGQVRDVWIDLGGFCTGALLCVLAAWIGRRHSAAGGEME